MKNASTDPFYNVKAAVEKEMQGVRQLFARWRALVENPAIRKEDGELSWTTDEILELVRTIGYDVTDLDETIKIVESSRSRFKISDEELQSRRNFVQQSFNELDAIRREVTSPAAKGMINKNNKGALTGGASDAQSRLDRQIETDNDKFIQSQVMVHRQIEQEQEVYIDQIIDNMGTMEQMGHEMEDEITRHNALLDDLSNLADNTGNRLRRTMKDIDKLIENSSNTVSYTIIAILILVVIGLFLSLIYL